MKGCATRSDVRPARGDERIGEERRWERREELNEVGGKEVEDIVEADDEVDKGIGRPSR